MSGARGSPQEEDSCGVKLTQLFLFASLEGLREGEEEKKLLFHHPPDTDMNQQVASVGLVEAVVRFNQTFSQEPARSLHTQKNRTVFLEVEEGYWLCLVVAVPYLRRGEVVEFRPDEVGDDVLLGVLTTAHQMFSLFHGGIGSVMEEGSGDMEVLKQKVSHFYSRYLHTLHIELADVLDVWCGVQYLPLEPSPFLRVQSLVNRLEEQIPEVHGSLYLQQGQLAWSGLPPGTTRLLVHYMATSLLPAAAEKRHNNSSSHPGRFLVGGGDAALPVVHVDSEKFQLVVYHAINSTLCLLLRPDTQADSSLYAKLHDIIGPDLANLSADLTHIWTQKLTATAPPEQVRFLYHNSSNMAVKSTADGGDMVRLAGDLVTDLARLDGDSAGEVTVKLSTDQWVVARCAGARTILVLMMQKNLNLMEVAEEVAKLDKSCFENICMI